MLKTNLDKRREMILNGNVVKTIILLTIPTFMMGIVQVLIPFSDGLFLNNILGNDVGAAVSYMQPALNILLAISQGLGVVSMAMIGQLNGKGDKQGIKDVALQVLVFGFLIGVLLMPICLLAADILAPKNLEIKNYAILYLSLSSLVIPFQFMASIFNSIKSATGEPEATFYRMVVLLLLKLLFNYVYLIYLNLGIKGSVYASITAYFFTTLWMYYDLFIRKYEYKLSLKKFKFKKEVLKELVKLSIPSMLAYMTINLAFMLINFEAERYGTKVLAGLAIANQINNICFILPTCIATTTTTMISINMGLSRVKKSKKIFLKSLLICLILVLILVLLLLPFSENIVNMYKPRSDIKFVAKEALEIYTYTVFPYAIFIICQSVFNALGKNVYPLIMSLLRIWVFRYLFIIFTSEILSYRSIFYGNLFSNFLAAIIFLILVLNGKWESKIKYDNSK